jgi:Protein of unknown function (DUF4239)
MGNFPLSVLTFILLTSVAFLSMYLHTRLAEHHRDSETAAAVSKIANIFVVITSLVFGLLITSSKSTFEGIDRNIHSYATELILLDRLLRNYGPDASNARAALKAYVEEAIAHPAQTDELEHTKSDTAGHALDRVGVAIDAIQPADSFHERLLTNAQNNYRDVVRQRWIIVEQSEGAIPNPIVGMLIAWLTLIFASFGYRAPKNAVVVSMLLISSMLISASLYLILDMNLPFKGPIRISYEPYHRALNEMREP